MNLDVCKRILKYAGILMIVGAVLTIILGVASVMFGASSTAMPEAAADEEMQKGIAALLVGGAFIFISGIVDLIAGIISVKASGDSKYAKAAFIFSIISLISACAYAYRSFTTPGATVSAYIEPIASVVLSILVCYAAYLLMKDYKEKTIAE